MLSRARRWLVVLCTAVLATAASTVNAEPAQANAYTGGVVDAIQSSADWDYVASQLRSPTGIFNSATNTSTNVPAEWAKVRMATPGVGLGGAEAATVSTWPTVAVVAAGLYLGWEIGHASGLSDWFYGKTSGANAHPTEGAISAGTFSTYTCASTNDWNPCAGRYAAGVKIWELGHTGGTCTSSTRATTSWEAGWSALFTGCGSAANAELLAFLQGNVGYLGAWAATGDCTGDAGTNDCYGVFLGPDQLRSSWTIQRAGTYNSTNDAGDKTATITAMPKPTPPDYGTAAATATETAIEDNPMLAPALGELLHPGITGSGSPTETVTLPQPRLNETAAQYRDRLRALGFLGTITLAENTGVDILPEFGPLVVTQVEVQTTTTTTTIPLLSPWPEPPPTLTVPGDSTTVTIEHNPNTAPAPAPGDPGSTADPPPGNAPPPGGGGTINVGDCSCPAPDFSPITDADYGGRFPFGVLTMFEGLMGTTLYASPDAPVFDFDFTSFEAGDFGPYNLGHYTVDLDVLDSYASIIRTLLSWVIWIGGIYWFGSRWLGFKGSGDPGEVVDEVWA